MRPMTSHSHPAGYPSIAAILIAALLCVRCGAFSDQTLMTDSPEGAVYLQQLSNRGATARYSGPLKSFKASHPIDLAPDTLAKTFAGLQIGILASDESRNSRGIKPTPVFSARQVAFLAPAVASALKRAQPDQRIKFQVGSGDDVTAGTLYVDGPVLHVAFSHYHSPAGRHDGQLSIYALSFEPGYVQVPSATPQTWMEVEPDQPRVALAYEPLAKLPAILPLEPALPEATSATAPPSADTTPASKAAVDKQAKELEAMRAELEALKKQLSGQEPKTKAKPNATP